MTRQDAKEFKIGYIVLKCNMLDNGLNQDINRNCGVFGEDVLQLFEHEVLHNRIAVVLNEDFNNPLVHVCS